MTLLERARKWGAERDRRLLEKGIENGRREGFERGRPAAEREWVIRLVVRRIGVFAATQFFPVLKRLSEAELITAIAQLPSHTRFSDIRELEEVRSPEELEEMAEVLAAWVERAEVPELLDHSSITRRPRSSSRG